jgi:hypothetical protein
MTRKSVPFTTTYSVKARHQVCLGGSQWEVGIASKLGPLLPGKQTIAPQCRMTREYGGAGAMTDGIWRTNGSL